MRIWRQDFRILSSDVDLTRKIRLSILFTKLQEAAIAHTIELGVTREKTLDRGLLWAVTQYRLKTDRMPPESLKTGLRIHWIPLRSLQTARVISRPKTLLRMTSLL